MWQSLPQFGTAVVYAILAAAGYTFAVSLAAGAGRPRLLSAARFGAYGTVALIGLAVLTLAYAFVSHDYRLNYVSRYSDRGMSVPYQIVALWGGQDGSWLWWLFLTAFFCGICVWWMGRRYRELQPYVIATMMTVLAFDAVLLIFAVAPFATNIGGAPVDGAGLNYQLRNFYMIIHPPSLYIGFTSAVVPFSFAIAALVTGRLDNEWIDASRKWMLFSWLFLTIGNVLGMMWAYEELGWGGDWAWDPVENAACLPWWTASAFVHSTMIQERRGMLKVWNVFLICATFWLTIFGTFLTRSGLIASVHSFAQSNIGNYFLGYMGIIVAVCVGLILWRVPLLRSEGTLESPLSREAAFLGNNWALLGCGGFIAVATTWPLFSEGILKYKSTVGPTFYNFWLPIPLVMIFALMCVAPLLGWRKTSPELFRKGFIYPVGAGVLLISLHFAFAGIMRMPPFVKLPNLYPLPTGDSLARMDAVGSAGAKLIHYLGEIIAFINGKLPAVVTFLAGFKIAVVIQEYVRGVRARQRSAKERNETEPWYWALARLVNKSRRRYAGYTVHIGIVLIYVHFAGRVWTTDIETSIAKGDTLQIDEAYTVRYIDSRVESDPEKRVIITELEVIERSSLCVQASWPFVATGPRCPEGKVVGVIAPSKFIYKSMGGQMSTEVARHITLRDDLYATLANVDPQTELATFQFHVNPFAVWLLFGAGIMVIGALISLWPDVSDPEITVWSYMRAATGFATTVIFCGMLVVWPRVTTGPPAKTAAAGATLPVEAPPPAADIAPSSP